MNTGMQKKLSFLLLLFTLTTEATLGQRSFDNATGCYIAGVGTASSSALYLKSDSSFTFRWSIDGVAGNTSGRWQLAGRKVELTSYNPSTHNVEQDNYEHMDCVNMSVADVDKVPICGANLSRKTPSGWQLLNGVTNADGVMQLSNADFNNGDTIRFDAFGFGSVTFRYTLPNNYYQITLPTSTDTTIRFNHTLLRRRGHKLLIPAMEMVTKIPLKLKKQENGCFY